MLTSVKTQARIVTSVLALMLPLSLSMQTAAAAQTDQTAPDISLKQPLGYQLPTAYEKAKAELPQDLYVIYRIVDRIVRTNDIDTRFWRVRIVPEYSTKAYAHSAYVITLDKSLLDLMAGDVSALAFVIAHEMAHHSHGHISELIESAHEASIDVSSADNQQEAQKRLREWQERIQKLSHNLELEADRIAYQYLARAGFDPEGSVRGLNTLAELPGGGLKSKTHPTISQRIEAIEALMVENPPKQLARRGRIQLLGSKPLTYELSDNGNSLRVDSKPRKSFEEQIEGRFGQ
ncbi:MAG: M48 family metalloprotease [Moorea sp. SIO4G2]|uniref:Peptidase M48 domain-containing protein n=1 Tax=Moorena bouillonii PNG TaxID=568701 RepID=A0A1U7N1R1_9CYAN|nr:MULTISPECIES: M48 family metallopeptidase [Moorena]NEO14771.1 M48 family metalloprotease [Moorena sp. SIO3E8]NEO63212.1 M48 family metalloprotease [Moorena sp. SIO4G2]NEQ01169.1 M48 family metalloprotease [Moorena sp. SIO3F7]OLT59872.1 hypothetical protein BJP37_13425 [Moorena bouillonii PNG]